MESFDRAYFPSFAEQRRSEELIEKPTSFGIKLAREVVSDIKRVLR
jgi:hypothetical protein